MDRQKVIEAIRNFAASPQEGGILHAVDTAIDKNKAFVKDTITQAYDGALQPLQGDITSNVARVNEAMRKSEEYYVEVRRPYPWSAPQKVPPDDTPKLARQNHDEVRRYSSQMQQVNYCTSNLERALGRYGEILGAWTRHSALSAEEGLKIKAIDSDAATEAWLHHASFSAEEAARIKESYIAALGAVRDRTKNIIEQSFQETVTKPVNFGDYTSKYTPLHKIIEDRANNRNKPSLRQMSRALATNDQLSEYKEQLGYLETVLRENPEVMTDKDLESIYDELVSDLQSLSGADFHCGNHWDGQKSQYIPALSWADGKGRGNMGISLEMKDTFNDIRQRYYLNQDLEKLGGKMIEPEVSSQNTSTATIEFGNLPPEEIENFIKEVKFSKELRDNFGLVSSLKIEMDGTKIHLVYPNSQKKDVPGVFRGILREISAGEASEPPADKYEPNGP